MSAPCISCGNVFSIRSNAVNLTTGRCVFCTRVGREVVVVVRSGVKAAR